MAYIKDKEQKILWGRSAGMCSLCRVKLTIDDGDGDPSTVGAMCHIVGEKEGSARYHSNLTEEERNSYSNLVLMCSHDHDIIDKDEKTYTIEKLHIIKTDHEVWVNENLSNQNPEPDELVYSALIDTITLMLKLEIWPWFIDHAVRNLVHFDFVDAQGVLNRKLLGTIWPDKKPELKEAIVAVLDAFDRFMVNFQSNAELRDNNFLGTDLTYKRIYPNPEYHKYKEKEDAWADINFWLLCNYTNKVNNFASAVRKYSNPMYFRIAGKFLIEDQLGYRFGGANTIFDPADEDIVKRLDDLGYALE
jgi:hypothetical protein